ncbi:transposase [Moheibacter sp. BDHS18]|uniref:Transposase n=2 Tax=Moheibacter lacus TaxID=2745851 RepID=A0A838ZU26_9FLAO|nr:transposase [Moheibacter lacus]
MPENFKSIHIGKYIQELVTEKKIDIRRICNFLGCSEKKIEEIYKSPNVSTDELLKLSKLLEYDFFRIYSQHLILYAPPTARNPVEKSQLPKFKKNIYTKEIIDFILEEIKNGEKSKAQIIKEYGIPKTTLYKWISKYENL